MEQGVFVAEGPRVVAAALEHRAPVQRIYASESVAVRALAAAAGVPIIELAPGEAERIGDTRTPQPVFALVARPTVGIEALTAGSLVTVVDVVSDPGNLGTLMRSALAAGGTAMGIGPGSVDAYNPKVVRASAGACFAIRTVEGVAAVDMLETLGAHGFRRVAAVTGRGSAPEALDLRGPTAIVLGHEARGLGSALPVDERVTIPMVAGESLNLATAGSVLLFEAARQRRSRDR